MLLRMRIAHIKINIGVTIPCKWSFVFMTLFMMLFLHLVGIASALHERPGQNERSVLNQLVLLLFRCFSCKVLLFTKSTGAFHEKHKMSFRVITKYIQQDTDQEPVCCQLYRERVPDPDSASPISVLS